MCGCVQYTNYVQRISYMFKHLHVCWTQLILLDVNHNAFSMCVKARHALNYQTQNHGKLPLWVTWTRRRARPKAERRRSLCWPPFNQSNLLYIDLQSIVHQWTKKYQHKHFFLSSIYDRQHHVHNTNQLPLVILVLHSSIIHPLSTRNNPTRYSIPNAILKTTSKIQFFVKLQKLPQQSTQQFKRQYRRAKRGFHPCFYNFWHTLQNKDHCNIFCYQFLLSL